MFAPLAAAQNEPGGGEESCEIGGANECLVQAWGIDTYCDLGDALDAIGRDNGKVSVLAGVLPSGFACTSLGSLAFAVLWVDFIPN